MIPLSQGQLTLLETCPRRFKHFFIDGLSGPASYEQKIKTQWGAQFHLLMQQRSLDLPIEVMSDADAEMMDRLSALAKTAPDIFQYLPISAQASKENVFVQSEQRRTFAFNDYLLTVIYDLVIETPSQGQIFDWKTHQQPPRKEWLQTDWQTRLYLYVLAETTALSPEQISMTYCFVRINENSPDKTQPDKSQQTPPPSFYRFSYSAAQHEQTKRDLQALTQTLTSAIAQLKTNQNKPGHHEAFPKIDESKGLCDRCPFAIRCDRAISTFTGTNRNSDPYHLLRKARQITAETVEEIPL